MKHLGFMARDCQSGDLIALRTQYPRKELLKMMDRKHADKIYIGEGRHIGWIIGTRWFEVFRVLPLLEGTP